MSFVIGPSVQVGSRAGQAAITTISRQPFVAQTSKGISEFFSNLFKGIAPAAKSTVTQVTKKPTIPTTIKTSLTGISKNVAIGSGTILGTTALLSLTQGGQNLVDTTGQSVQSISQLGGNITDFFNKNPIVPIGLLILGGLIVVSVIKK